MRWLSIVTVLASSVVLAACGAESPQGDAIPPHQPGVISGPSGALDVVVREPANRADSAVRYLRIEDLNGKPVLEREFKTAPAEFSTPLAVARYRVVTWSRECTGSCQAATDANLGRPLRICGSRVDVADGALARVSVDAPADADCAMTVA